ncbi:MAG TPA: hypothetical protein VHO93_17645 [Actinomycetota bacterium]|jgi:hypothetical protein|nr:hypothetical protein [Actinomycetota bacterium]
MEPLLNSKQATDLVGLLAVVAVQTHLGHEYREEADYWAGQVDPGLAAEDAETIVWLLEEVAGSLWLPRPMEQWARSWVVSLEELAGGADSG